MLPQSLWSLCELWSYWFSGCCFLGVPIFSGFYKIIHFSPLLSQDAFILRKESGYRSLYLLPYAARKFPWWWLSKALIIEQNATRSQYIYVCISSIWFSARSLCYLVLGSWPHRQCGCVLSCRVGLKSHQILACDFHQLGVAISLVYHA